MTVEHLRFAPDILRRLGEELIPHAEQGIVELVRNAYDADAHQCIVELHNTGVVGGTIVIRDDGLGMGITDIRAGWLVIGRSRKEATRRTALGRLQVGDKGLGRLAALRLGTKAVMVSRPSTNVTVEYEVVIDWGAFATAATVEVVPISVSERPRSGPPGTTITIQGLTRRLSHKETERLARALVLLSDPFEADQSFKATLVAPGFADLERKVREGYLEDAEYHLKAVLSAEGQARATVTDWKGKPIWQANHGQIRGKESAKESYQAPTAEFELWVYLLEGKKFSKRTAKLGEVKAWLAEVGGVHLYHRGLRVYPYGDKGHDWLDMNLSRSRNPELRPSTNTSVGRVIVLDERDALLQKTDRTGFVENEAFSNLRQFAIDALEWMAKERVRARDTAKARERQTIPQSLRRAKESFRQVVEGLPTPARGVIEGAVRTLEHAHDRQTRLLRDELELYRTLSTVGTTVAVFAHESTKPVSQIEKMAVVAEQRGRAELGDRYDQALGRPVQIILTSAQALKTFANVPLKLLEQSRRRGSRVDVHQVVTDTVALFEPFLSDARIQVTLELVDRPVQIRGNVAAVQAIVANLITNSINAFSSASAKLEERALGIRTEVARETLILRVLDSGPGIGGIDLEDIWLPGQTTTTGGTGLGLAIVRDTVADLEGKASAVAKGDLGGAEFIIELPLLKDDQ